MSIVRGWSLAWLGTRYAALAAVAVACAAAFVGAAAAAAACSNEALRSGANSTQLPECRAYELVSPVDTADSGVVAFKGAAHNGEAAEFISTGGFADAESDYAFNLYIARRGSEGWGTSWVGVPATLGGTTIGTTTSFDLTKQLVRVQFLTGVQAGTTGLLLSDNLAAAPEFTFKEVPEFSNVPHNGTQPVVEEQADESPGFSYVVVPGTYDSRGGRILYELAGVGGPTPTLRTASVDHEGNTIDGVVGSGEGRGGSMFHAISNNGAELFYTKYETEVTNVSYVRMSGSKPVELGGLFQGASEDGARVFIRSAGGALTMDEIASEAGQAAVTGKVPVSQGASALYVRSSDDGSHVYFVSKSVLTGLVRTKNENEEEAKVGEWNLYVYDALTKETAFIARTLPGDSEPAIVRGIHLEAQVSGCPSSELGELGETEEAGCEGGRFFVFTSEAKLTPDDTASGTQVFEYDAKTGRLMRVSAGEGGYNENGNGGSGNATIAAPELGGPGVESQTELFEDGTRAVSDDGSTVVFTSTRSLSSRALNNQSDIYEWHDGQVGMISTGHSTTADEEAAITPSGRDIFFTSTEGIVPQDSDDLRSLYDARVGGGFKAPPVEEGGCNGDSCQGPPSVAELLGQPSSATLSGLGNVKPPVVEPKPKPKPKRCGKGYVKRRGRCVKARKKHRAVKSGRRGG